MRFGTAFWAPDPPIPFWIRDLSSTELHLACFMTWLLQEAQAEIPSATTILVYEVHTICSASRVVTPNSSTRQLSSDKYGEELRESFPVSLIGELPFVASAYSQERVRRCDHGGWLFKICVTIMGFVRMLRPQTFSQLSPSLVELVL